MSEVQVQIKKGQEAKSESILRRALSTLEVRDGQVVGTRIFPLEAETAILSFLLTIPGIEDEESRRSLITRSLFAMRKNNEDSVSLLCKSIASEQAGLLASPKTNYVVIVPLNAGSRFFKARRAFSAWGHQFSVR